MQNKFKTILKALIFTLSLTTVITPAAANDVDPCTLLGGNWFGKASFNDVTYGPRSTSTMSVTFFFSPQYSNEFSMIVIVGGDERSPFTSRRYHGSCNNGALQTVIGGESLSAGEIKSNGIVTLYGDFWNPYCTNTCSGYNATLHKVWMFGTTPPNNNEQQTQLSSSNN
jgi:hypothetical protein